MLNISVDIHKTCNMLQRQLCEWVRETGAQPAKIAFKEDLFNKLCAELADLMYRKDKGILEMVNSFRFHGPLGYVIIERGEE